jgi:glucose 1-dehydrogenase
MLLEQKKSYDLHNNTNTCAQKRGSTMQLEGKVALVTGGSLGIGEAIARAFGREGARVTVDYLHHRESAQHLAQELGQDRAIAVQADISKTADIARLVDATVGRFGRLDILINNAGIEMPTPFLEVTEDQWDKQLAVDLKGPFFAAQIAARQMVKQKKGKIINISSVHEDLPMPGNSVYCAAKGGLRMLIRTLADELAPHHINVVGIGPGAIATPINKQTLEDPQKKHTLLQSIPLKRVGQPEDVAGLAVWLASDAADYVTGTTFFIDGGLMVNAGSL